MCDLLVLRVRLTPWVLGALSVLSLGACGGGGGGAGTFTVGGTISGLSASGLVLADNGGDNLSVPSGATSFTFSTQLQSGASYNVTVATQPTGASCTVAAGSGTVSGNVVSVSVACAATTYTVSGSVSGLTSPGLKLKDYSAGEILAVPANATTFAFTRQVPYGTNVSVTITAQPAWQWCTAGSSNFSGPITSNVSTETFGCAAATSSGSAVTTGATFNAPAGVELDSSGNLYIADTGNNRILEISPAGTVTTLLSLGNGLSSPQGVAVDSAGNVYVANTNNNEILKRTPSGSVSKLAPTFSFNQPAGVAVDPSGNVYVADTKNNAIREISSSSGQVTTLTGTFSQPTGVAVDSSGHVYVADNGNNRIVDVSGGTAKTLPGTYNSPIGVTVDSAGDVYVADTNDFEVRMITPAGTVATVAGSSSAQGSCAAKPALFHNPFGVAVDPSGDLYVSDYFANQVCKLAPGP